MSARNTFVTKFIYGFDKATKISVILSGFADDYDWSGKFDAGYFAGRCDTLGEPPYEEVLRVIKEIRQFYPDFDMAVVCDDWPSVIHTASLEEMGFSLD
jgi:hypothetical protein